MLCSVPFCLSADRVAHSVTIAPPAHVLLGNLAPKSHHGRCDEKFLLLPQEGSTADIAQFQDWPDQLAIHLQLKLANILSNLSPLELVYLRWRSGATGFAGIWGENACCFWLCWLWHLRNVILQCGLQGGRSRLQQHCLYLIGQVSLFWK